MTTTSAATGGTELSGLDGANPLGYLAAVGALVTARSVGEAGARLRWTRGTTWVPLIESVSTTDAAAFSDVIARGLAGRSVSEDGVERREKAQVAWERASKAVRDKLDEIKGRRLKGAERKAAIESLVRPLEQERDPLRQEWLKALAEVVPRPELALGKQLNCTSDEYREHARSFAASANHASREVLDLLAAFGTDACLRSRSEVIEATPFCFITGSGHQYFLDTVGQLVSRVSPELVRRTLFEAWRYSDEGLSMRWDPKEDRRYALMDRDPTVSGNKPTTVWMANLLGYRALALFPSAPSRDGLEVTGWSGLGEELAFTWPIWQGSLSLDGVRSVLQLKELSESRPDRSALRSRGIVGVFRARRIKVGTGANFKLNFSPARAV
jgi:hypothetical protein